MTATSLQVNPSDIRSILHDFLHRCGMGYPITDAHTDFYDECVAISIARGYIKPEDDSFRRFIPSGVHMACNAYAHIPDKSIRLYVCFYTAFLVYLDDMFENDIDAVKEFNNRFVAHKPQRHWILDHLAGFLLEMPKIFGDVVANMMTTSALNLITALLLEDELKGVPLERDAVRYPNFSRTMSGSGEFYALSIFRPDIPLKTYIQALPELMIFINTGNDVLSFYKEELAGETMNRVSLIAKCQGSPRSQILAELVDETVGAHHRIVGILKPYKASYDSYLAFCQGYVGFHAGLGRYRLDELKL